MNAFRRAGRRVKQMLKGRDRGTVAIGFILTLPILLAIIGVLVQLALLVNAHFVLHRALAVAARSAMTSLPADQNIGDAGGPDFVRRSALMTLESLSPQTRGEVSEDGVAIADALSQVGLNPPDGTYAARYTYADEVTLLTIVPIDQNGQEIGAAAYAQSPAPRVRLTLSYDFYLTVPGTNIVIGRTATLGGITGRFLTMTASMDVQLSPGREAVSNDNGDP